MYHARNSVLYQRGQTVPDSRNESVGGFHFNNPDYRRYQLNGQQEIYSGDISVKPVTYQVQNSQLPDYLSETNAFHRSSPTIMKEPPVEQGYVTSSLYNCKADLLANIKDECSDLSGYSSSDTGNELDWAPAGTGRSHHDRLNFNGAISDQPYRQRKSEMFALDDEERKKIRRERNKMAAAKCRQRRVDLTNELLSQTEKLEDQRRALQKEIDSLQHQRSQLEYVLGAHAPRCRISRNNGSDGSAPFKQENGQNLTKTGLISSAEFIQLKNQSAAKTGRNDSCCSGIRPDSLELHKSTASSASAVGCNGATKGFAKAITDPGLALSHLGLDSMMDGHTGLTPITGQPTYSSQSMDTFCENDVTPTNNMTLMNL